MYVFDCTFSACYGRTGNCCVSKVDYIYHMFHVGKVFCFICDLMFVGGAVMAGDLGECPDTYLCLL